MHDCLGFLKDKNTLHGEGERNSIQPYFLGRIMEWVEWLSPKSLIMSYIEPTNPANI